MFLETKSGKVDGKKVWMFYCWELDHHGRKLSRVFQVDDSVNGWSQAITMIDRLFPDVWCNRDDYMKLIHRNPLLWIPSPKPPPCVSRDQTNPIN